MDYEVSITGLLVAKCESNNIDDEIRWFTSDMEIGILNYNHLK